MREHRRILGQAPSTNGGMLTHLDTGLNGHAGSGFHLHLNRLVDRVGQLLLGRIAHRLGPDAESPFPGWGNFPETPDAFPFIVAAIRHVVLANVPLGPPALSVLDLVSTSDQERPGRGLCPSSPPGERSDAAPSGIGQGGGTSEKIRTKARRRTDYRSRFATPDKGESESGISSSSPAWSVPR